MYRHVDVLAETGVLEVDSEQRVRGAVERRYRLRRERATLDSDTAAAASVDDYRRGFAAAMAALLGEFEPTSPATARIPWPTSSASAGTRSGSAATNYSR